MSFLQAKLPTPVSFFGPSEEQNQLKKSTILKE